MEIYILGTIFWKLPCKENGDQNKFIQAFNRAKKKSLSIYNKRKVNFYVGQTYVSYEKIFQAHKFCMS